MSPVQFPVGRSAPTPWVNLTLGTSIGTPSHGYPPQVMADGDWVMLRGRIDRTGGFSAGDLDNVFTVPIPFRPLQAVSFVVNGESFSTPRFARLEVNAAGVARIGCSLATAWLSLDGARWPRS